ncbi:MAG: FkbM family methyltransferase [Candidatus Binataceae bacterium]
MKLLELVTPDSGELTARIFGSKMSLNVGEYVQRRMYFGCHERMEAAQVAKFLRPGMTVVDVGANVGYYTALASSRVGRSGRVFSLEPDPEPYRRLETTVRANNLANVKTFAVGLSDKPGTLELFRRSDSVSDARAVFIPDARRFVVPVTTLDRFLDEQSINVVDLLKVDVAGHETKVMEGASRTLARGRIKAILCEFYYYWLRREGSSAEQLWQLLRSVGFHTDAPFHPDRNYKHFMVLRAPTKTEF